MITFLIKIFIIGFFLNLLYELLHSLLYKTCLEAKLPKYIYLILKACIFDAVLIVTIYYFSFLIFQNQNLFLNFYQTAFVVLVSIIFAYFYEIYAINNKRWEYSKAMPKIFGAGITPIIQIALTGILTYYLALYF